MIDACSRLKKIKRQLRMNNAITHLEICQIVFTCVHNSRVGAKTIAFTNPLSSFPLEMCLLSHAFPFNILCSNGKEYANVFPVPVLARTSKSLPDVTANGRHLDWTSVGRTYPRRDRALRSRISIPRVLHKVSNVSDGSKREEDVMVISIYHFFGTICWANVLALRIWYDVY